MIVFDPLPNPQSGFTNHAHSNFELQYIRSGNVEQLLDNTRSVFLDEGQLMLIPPHMLHKSRNHRANRGYAINFSLLPSEVDDNMISPQASYVNKLLDLVNSELVFQNEQIAHSLLRIYELDRKDIVDRNKIQTYLSLVFQEIVSILREKHECDYTTEHIRHFHGTPAQDFLRNWLIDTYVSNFYMYKNHVQNLAQLLHLSERQTVRVVQVCTNKNLHDLILEHRMKIAVEFILHTTLSLNEIAETIGYNSYNGFYMAFQKFHGHSPEKLREPSLE